MIGSLEFSQRADDTHTIEPGRRHVRCAASVEELIDLGLAREFAIAQGSYIDEIDARAPVAKRRNEGRKPWPQTEVDAIVGYLRALHESPRNPEIVWIAPDGEAPHLPHCRRAAVRTDDEPRGDRPRSPVLAKR